MGNVRTETEKAFTIRDARITDIDKFNDFKYKLRKTAGGAFTELLNHINPELSQETSQENNDLDNNNSFLDGKTFKEHNIELQNKIKSLELALETAEPVKIEVEKKLTGTQFICEPTPEMAKDMQRAILYLIKNGELNRHDKNLVSQFNTMAIKYFLKNEFNSILK